MTGILLSVHVIAAILAIGPAAVAASMFPPAGRAALAEPGNASAASTVRTLHRITRVYAAIGIVVPVFGAATAVGLGVLGDGWLLTSIAITAAAALLLIVMVLPGQRQIVDALDGTDTAEDPASVTRMLGMTTGMFNLLWAIVVVLMIFRPGSTTGV